MRGFPPQDKTGQAVLTENFINSINLFIYFLNIDAAEVMEMLLKTQMGDNELTDDDPQMSYMISAWARICKILGPRFAPYLPVVMPAIMKTASMKPEVQ